MYDWDGGWGWGGWLTMTLVMLVFWGSIVALIILLIRGTGNHHQPAAPTPPPEASEASALRILQERFARGEIDAEEYERRRSVLRSA